MIFIVLGSFFNLDIAFRENAITNFTMLLYAIYYVYLLGRKGQTWGKKLFGLKVVKSNGEPISYVRAFFRFLANPNILEHSLTPFF